MDRTDLNPLIDQGVPRGTLENVAAVLSALQLIELPESHFGYYLMLRAAEGAVRHAQAELEAGAAQ